MLMRYWAGMYPEEEKKKLEAGVDIMLKIALKILEASNKGQLKVQGKDGDGQGS